MMEFQNGVNFLIVLIIVCILIYAISKRNVRENFTNSEINEAITNVASLYNNSNMTVSNMTITGALTMVDGTGNKYKIQAANNSLSITPPAGGTETPKSVVIDANGNLSGNVSINGNLAVTGGFTPTGNINLNSGNSINLLDASGVAAYKGDAYKISAGNGQLLINTPTNKFTYDRNANVAFGGNISVGSNVTFLAGTQYPWMLDLNGGGPDLGMYTPTGHAYDASADGSGAWRNWY